MEKEIELCERKLKWSWAKFGIGLSKLVTDRAFWAFMFVIGLTIYFGVTNGFNPSLWWGCIVMGGIFVFSKAIEHLIKYKTNMNVNTSLGAALTKNK